jgi:hypothetical protein
MKNTIIALVALVVVVLALLFFFGRAAAPGPLDTAGDGMAATSSARATSTGAVSGAATGTLDVNGNGGREAPAFYYKG